MSVVELWDRDGKNCIEIQPKHEDFLHPLYFLKSLRNQTEWYLLADTTHYQGCSHSVRGLHTLRRWEQVPPYTCKSPDRLHCRVLVKTLRNRLLDSHQSKGRTLSYLDIQMLKWQKWFKSHVKSICKSIWKRFCSFDPCMTSCSYRERWSLKSMKERHLKRDGVPWCPLKSL